MVAVQGVVGAGVAMAGDTGIIALVVEVLVGGIVLVVVDTLVRLHLCILLGQLRPMLVEEWGEGIVRGWGVEEGERIYQVRCKLWLTQVEVAVAALDLVGTLA